ncbi:MAG: hypothetical protein O7B99_11085 [Planctomycetota bacterium]|nr:hypothetical protein [Planctomycetota bacterium]
MSVAALVLVCALAPGQDEAVTAAAVKSVARLRRGAREELYEELASRIAECGAPQVALVAEWVEEAGLDPTKLPEAERGGPHDGKKYGGGSRRRVKPSSRKWKELAAKIADEAPPRALAPLVTYDFGAGVLVRKAKEKGDETIPLRNALAGFPPDQDLAEALFLQRLDALGRHRQEAIFFAHTYVDLKNQAFRGISLYDVWSHQIPIDVPDVDVRAYADIVHGRGDLPPILRGPDQKLWYPRMSDSLFALRRHVLIARAIAACWFQGRPKLPGGYERSVDTLHATFALEAKNAERVAARFERLGPGFVEQSLDDVNQSGGSAWNSGNARRTRMLDGQDLIRQVTLDFLREKQLIPTKE